MIASKIRQQIEMLLSVNLLISDEVRQQILSNADSALFAVLPFLEQINLQEQKVLERVLYRNPHLFKDLDHELSRDELKKMLLIESQDRVNEMDELDTFLTTALADI